jgi:FKBP-type peptidyl-prolyl cis-trans isomerase FklB
MQNHTDSVSYALGLDYGNFLTNLGIEFNSEAFLSGLKDALAGNPKLTQQELEVLKTSFQRKANEMQQKKMMEKYQVNKQEGELFLAENKSKEGVVTLPSGLQYKVLRPGSGAKPTAASTVKVHYEGRLLDGKVFDSSYQRNEPIEFPLSGVIPGWTEGVQQMPVGSKYTLYIPWNLAYGERGAPPTIPPFSTLIFDVELLEIK